MRAIRDEIRRLVQERITREGWKRAT